MKSSQSRLKKKHISVDEQKYLVRENEITSHLKNRETNHIVCFNIASMPLGRIASLVANVLNNKYDINRSSHEKFRYKIVLYNCDQFILTGNKMSDKVYTKYTGYPGGQRQMKFVDIFNKNIRTAFELVIKRMLNENRSRQSTLNNISYIDGELSENLQKNQNVIQTTVNKIIAEWQSKRSA